MPSLRLPQVELLVRSRFIAAARSSTEPNCALPQNHVTASLALS